jgi:DNA-binding transcriptional LysR family regulator
MELHQIRAFVAVARVGNVTKAAEVLCLTQPAVTGQIKGLESSLGVALFDRTGGRLSLTRAGEKLLPSAEQLLAVASEVKGLARSMQGELNGRIDLGLPSEGADFLRTAALALKMQTDLPLVELHTHTQAMGSLLDQVRGGALAGAFAIATHPPRGLNWLAVRSVSYRIAFPISMRATMERGGWRVLACLPWADSSVDSHVHLMLRHLFEQQGLVPNVVLRTDDVSALESFVRSGSACALLREEVALPGVERGDWVVWGHARVDARLYFCTANERVGDPLVVALNSAVQAVWA